MTLIPHYLCPLCQQTLTLTDQSYCCKNNHSFDQAKQGYVNLLPVQFKHSKDPGDNKNMVAARRAFLNKGFYQPLVDKMLMLYQQYGQLDDPLLDAGCGEGFYSHQHKTTTNQVYGVDIAKEAIKIAAKRYENCHFSVGTLSKLSFADNYFSWITSVYAPILETEFTRVLNHGGYLLTVTPAQQHLYELKQLIYRHANEHDVTKSPINELTLITEQRLTYPMIFDNSDNSENSADKGGNVDVVNLLAMTPFAFKASDEVVEKIKNTEQFSCQADFILRLYQNI